MITGESAPAALTDQERLRVARSRFRRRFVFLMGGLLVLTVAGLSVAALLVHPRHKPPFSPWLAIGLFAALNALTFSLLFLYVWKRQLRLGSDAVYLTSEPNRTRAVMKALRKGQPIAAADAPIVRAYLRQAHRSARQYLWLVALGVCLVVLAVVAAVAGNGSWLHLLYGAIITLQGIWLWQLRARLRANAASQGIQAAPTTENLGHSAPEGQSER